MNSYSDLPTGRISTPSFRLRAAAELERRNRERRGEEHISFREYVTQTNPRYVWHQHCEMIADLIERIVDGKLRRVIIAIPPQHGKSELISRSLPGYFLMRHPERNVILTSYGDDLAHDLSAEAKMRYQSAGGSLRRDSQSKGRWRTPKGGGVRAGGVGSSITGHPADLLIVDDPVKNEEEASSRRHQEKLLRWWDSTAYTRVSEQGTIVIMATRWDPNDLTGQVLKREEGDHPEQWTVLSLPALSEERPQEFPPSCRVLPDFRKVAGQPLCEAIRSKEYLEGIRSRSLTFLWLTIWQQSATNPDGWVFKRKWFEDMIMVERHEVPVNAHRMRAWDKAGTEGAGDHTAGVLWARDRNGIYYIEDVKRGQWGDLKREEIIVQTAHEDDRITRGGHDGPRPQTLIEQEPGSGGKQSAGLSIRALAGFEAFIERPVTNKVVRARPLASYIQAGMVRMVKAPWNQAFIDEFCAFRHKDSQADQVDAASAGFVHLALRHGDTTTPHRDDG